MTQCNPLTPKEELDLAHRTIARCWFLLSLNNGRRHPGDGELHHRISITKRHIQIMNSQ